MMTSLLRWLSAILFLSILAACGSSEPVGAPQAEPVGGKAGAARLLTQGTFGPTSAEINRVATLTPEVWVSEQMALPPTYHLPECRRLRTNLITPEKIARTDTFWKQALTAPDQLRQRVAFALSQIMVVSDVPGSFADAQEGLCWYYDILLRNAFGDFRTLLEEVTLSPEMGRYLAMLGNQKPDPVNGRRADENFAREVMQLFTVGLVELNADGSPRSSGGQPIPTYSQTEIEGLARVFTGWTWAGSVAFGSGPENWLQPMQAFEDRHDTDAKTIIGDVNIPAGGSAQTDLDLALDTLFRHDNVGPFIGRQLIQKLVTSNPSRAYVSRVAAAFDDNGSGQRGDLGAVVRAVLLDPEARQGNAADSDFAKAREPLMRLSQLWRATQARPAASGRYSYRGAQQELAQSPLSSPSVFNFYSPFYSPPGEVRDAGLVAPELQLANESSLPLIANRLQRAIFIDHVGGANLDTTTIATDLGPLVALSADPAVLADELNLLFMNGQMTAAFRSALIDYLTPIAITQSNGRLRAQEALYLVLTSPQVQIQR